MEQVASHLSQIVSGWRNIIKLSTENEKRKKFFQTGKMCSHFYAGAMGFMWDESFRKTFLGGMPSPEFKLTIAKAFEMVAIMVPNLLWDYPGRVSKPVKRMDLPIHVFGDPDDPNAQAAYASWKKEQEAGVAIDEVTCQLMDKYLNYSQREQPGGGLVKASESAIIDAIVKGRGVMRTEPYKFPGSDRTLTRSVWVDVEDLYIDPDCNNADLTDAGWIAIRHVDKWFDVQRKFPGVPAEVLRSKSSGESVESLGFNASMEDKSHRDRGMTTDTIEWFEIFSKIGVGSRLKRVKSSLHEAFEEVVGDYARICIAKDINYPLNFPPKIAEVADDDMAREAFDWPVPYYKDGRWPVSLLDFYSIPNNPWPIAPLAMGLGELVFMNIMHSCLAERVYNTSRNLMFVNPAIGDEAMAALKNAKFSDIIEMNPQLEKGIQDFVNFLQMPQIPQDAFAMLDLTNQQFERRTGLSPLLYGATPGDKVVRSAADAQMKQEAAGIRTEDMGRKVERWQTDIANNERICAGWSLTGEDVADLFDDPLAVSLWDELIANADPEKYVRQMRTTLEANSLKKPNKARDVANLQSISGWMIPMLQWYTTLTMQMGEPSVAPLNGFIKSYTEALDQDAEAWQLPDLQPPPPPPSPEEDPAQQQAMAEQQHAMATKQQEMDMKSQEAAQKMQMAQQSHELDMQGKAMELQQNNAKNKLALAIMAQNLERATARGLKD